MTVDEAVAVMRRWAPYDGEQDEQYDADLDALVTAVRNEKSPIGSVDVLRDKLLRWVRTGPWPSLASEIREFEAVVRADERVRNEKSAAGLLCAGCGEWLTASDVHDGGHAVAGAPPDFCGPVLPPRSVVAHLHGLIREQIEYANSLTEPYADERGESAAGLNALPHVAVAQLLAMCRAGSFYEDHDESMAVLARAEDEMHREQMAKLAGLNPLPKEA